ncbi:hypothetical protein EYF80_014195 [Liparis tanakae]|uniref:Uncharacterized protein n=1 Tax=Liparis tanakae TaxID=230148 RepID=A0A4Z2IBY1_9TELE|nr:hypothetical protein EYF80_014195 [Liparis tanakae]
MSASEISTVPSTLAFLTIRDNRPSTKISTDFLLFSQAGVSDTAVAATGADSTATWTVESTAVAATGAVSTPTWTVKSTAVAATGADSTTTWTVESTAVAATGADSTTNWIVESTAVAATGAVSTTTWAVEHTSIVAFSFIALRMMMILVPMRGLARVFRTITGDDIFAGGSLISK